MRIEIIVLSRHTLKQIVVWEYVIDSDGPMVTKYDGEIFPDHEDVWENLALSINQLACADSGKSADLHLPVDLFLFVRESLVEHLGKQEDLAEHLRKNIHLEKLVKAAHEHTWGGNIYVAWEQAPETMFDALYNRSRANLEEWFGKLIQSGVADILEISKNDHKKEPNEYDRLHYRARASDERREGLRKLLNGGDWNVALHDDAFLIGEFLQTLVGPELESTPSKNLAVLYDKMPTKRTSWEQRFLKLHQSYTDGNLFVATTVQGDMSRTEMLWRQKSPGMKLFCFNGALEWLYSFVRLKHASQPALPRPTTAQLQDDVFWVPPSDIMLRRSEPGVADLRLLVTSAFHVKPKRAFDDDLRRREVEEQYCIATANEIGDVIRNLPFGVAVEIHHCIKCERLPDILKNKSFTAWLHLSHGSVKGLEEDRAGIPVSPLRWRDSFNVYEERLPLVIFSACESTAVAELFAESIASVAIGFLNPVWTTATRKLSAKVIPAALRAGGRQSVILEAFGKAVMELSSISYPGVRGSDANPKAFAAKLEAP
jgi:hypothetical protein